MDAAEVLASLAVVVSGSVDRSVVEISVLLGSAVDDADIVVFKATVDGLVDFSVVRTSVVMIGQASRRL